VTCATLLFGLFQFAVSRWLIAVHLSPNLHCVVQASIVALGAGFALWLILLGMMRRRRMMEDELRRVAELNHTLRNVLEIIVLAHYAVSDSEHKTMMMECANRIDQKLKELFPVAGSTRVRMKNGKWEISSGPRR
jgi:hypothetical protein